MVIVIIISLLMGSFANNLISYFTGKAEFDLARSKCFCGKKNLTLFELIPVLNYFVLRGKCRSCEKKISIRYPIVELLCMTMGIICYIQYGISIELLIWFLIYYLLIVMGIVDLISFIIPNLLIVILLVISILKIIFFNEDFVLKLAISFILIFILTIINTLSAKLKREIMGYGDIKLIGILFPILPFVSSLINIWLSSVIGIAGFYLMKNILPKFRYENRIPFGFFLTFGFIITHFFETDIINFYFRLSGAGN